MKIWSLLKHENLTTHEQVTKYCGKEEKLLLRSNFSSFPQNFQYISTGVKLHIHVHLLNVVVRFIFFLNSSNLICQGTGISKYFRESIGLRANESWLYMSTNRECPDHTARMRELSWPSLFAHGIKAFSPLLRIILKKFECSGWSKFVLGEGTFSDVAAHMNYELYVHFWLAQRNEIRF